MEAVGVVALRSRHFRMSLLDFVTLGADSLHSLTSLRTSVDAFALRQPATVVLARFRRFDDSLLTLRSYTRSFMTFWSRYEALQQFV